MNGNGINSTNSKEEEEMKNKLLITSVVIANIISIICTVYIGLFMYSNLVRRNK
jgi:hypothetical protein